MNLKTQIDQDLGRLAAHGTFAAGPQMLTVDTEAGRLECQMAALDSIGCEFDRLALVPDRLAARFAEELKRLGETLASRLTYLLEPIGVVEFDPEGCVVQLRSIPPHKDDDKSSYYELLARRGGQLSLSRYEKAPRVPRRVTSTSVTREVFCRLAGDFASVVS